MIVKTISYARLVNLGNYSNERIEATAEVEDDEHPDSAMGLLVSYVNRQLNAIATKRALAEKIAEQERRLRELNERRAYYQTELDKLSAKPESDRTDWERQRARDLPDYIADVEKQLANPDQEAEPADLPF